MYFKRGIAISAVHRSVVNLLGDVNIFPDGSYYLLWLRLAGRISFHRN